MSDRAVKERVIGAIVLVVFAVLVVPVFLDGPTEEEEIVSEAVTLPGQNNQERKQQTITLDRDRNEPVPATRTPPQAAATQEPPARELPAAQPAPVENKKTEVASDKPVPSSAAATAPAAATTAAPATATSTTGMWAVQLGSFSSQENAERLAASLRNQGYAAFLSQLQTGSGALHRVRVGPQKDRDSAEAIAAQLAKNGHTGQVVPHP